MYLSFNATKEEVGKSLIKTLSEIDSFGETPFLKSIMLYKYGILKFLDKNFDEAYKTFQECNVILIDNNLPEIKELYYWTTRIFEEKGDLKKAKGLFEGLLERARFINDQVFVNEILDRLNIIQIKTKT